MRDHVKKAQLPAGRAGRRATIRDVATRAGVSHQTVSRVINRNPNVAHLTRERVLAAIRELGYVPSPMARGLISNRSHSLGVVADDISDGFFARAVAGAEIEARRRGYYLLIASVERAARAGRPARGARRGRTSRRRRLERPDRLPDRRRRQPPGRLRRDPAFAR